MAEECKGSSRIAAVVRKICMKARLWSQDRVMGTVCSYNVPLYGGTGRHSKVELSEFVNMLDNQCEIHPFSVINKVRKSRTI